MTEGVSYTDLMTGKDAVYCERNMLVSALSRLYPAGTLRTKDVRWDPEWCGCVYIDLPSGQVSWHYHDRDATLFAHLPAYDREWDGHDTEEKYYRLGELRK